MHLSLKPVKPVRISDQVADQLLEIINQGDIKPGEKLPTEGALSDAFNVCRQTVRVAVSKLVANGLLEQRHGNGIFISRMKNGFQRNSLADAIGIQQAAPRDLIEVRLGMECNAAALAAERADHIHIQNLEQCLADIVSAKNHKARLVKTDMAFHMAISSATKNHVMISMMHHLQDLIYINIEKNLKRLYRHADEIERNLRQHAVIFQAIREKSSEKAYAAMHQHIAYSLDFFQTVEKSPELSVV